MSDKQHCPELTLEDFAHALQEMDSYIDVSAEDLMRINALAQRHARLRGVEGIPVSELMTADVITTRPEMALSEAANLLLEYRIAGLPVIDAEGKLAGVLTEADVLEAMGVPLNHKTHDLWQALETMFRQTPTGQGLDGQVKDAMTTTVVTIGEAHNVGEAIDRMKRHRIKRLVVTDDDSRVTGIITRSNLVRIFLENA